MQCTHIKPDGAQCRSNAMANQQYCWFHNPAVEKNRRAASSTGGKAFSAGIYAPLPPVKLQDHHQISDLLLDTLNMLRAGVISSRGAFAMAHIYKLLREWLPIDLDHKKTQEYWRILRANAQKEQNQQQNEEQDEDEDQDQDEDDEQDEDQE